MFLLLRFVTEDKKSVDGDRSSADSRLHIWRFEISFPQWADLHNEHNKLPF